MRNYTSENLNSINLKHYSQTCSNNHHCKTTTCLKRPMLSPPRQIPVQSLFYKTTTLPTRPAATFFDSQIKKRLKQPLQNLIQRRNAKQTQGTMHKK